MRALGRDRGCERSYPSSKPAISLSVEALLKFLGMFSSGSCKQILYVCALYRSQMCRQSMLRSHVDSPCQVLMSEVAGRMHKKPTLHTATVMWARGQHCTYIANIVCTKTSPLTFARPTLNTQVLLHTPPCFVVVVDISINPREPSRSVFSTRSSKCWLLESGNRVTQF